MVDMDTVIDILDEHGLIRKVKPIGDWYRIYCPFHNDGNEKKPSCGVRRVDSYKNGEHYPAGLFHCFSCGAAYDLETGVSKILESRNFSISGREWLVNNVPGYSPEEEADRLIPDNMANVMINKYSINQLNSILNKKVTYVSEDELKSYRYIVPYMYERKLTDKIIEDYDVGVDLNWIPEGRKRPVPCITFPVRDREKNTLFICRRSIEGKLFNYPNDVEKPVYGLDMLPAKCRYIIICESIINALTCVRYGHPAVALLGTGTPYQIRQLKELNVSEYILGLDGDNAGRKGAKKLKKALSRVGFVRVMQMPEGKDINDLEESEFRQIFDERE